MVFDLVLCRRWKFVWDSNHDGVLNYRELTSLLHSFFYLPAKAVMTLVDSQPHLRRFFESDCHTATGLGGGVFSLVAWLMLYGLIAQVAGDVRDASRGKGAYSTHSASVRALQRPAQEARRTVAPRFRHTEY